IDINAVRGRSGAKALRGWLLSAVIALAAGFLLGNSVEAAVIIAIALTGTALGTITPILRDAGLTSGPVGRALSAGGAMGEFLPLVAITVLLSGRSPLVGILTLLIFIAGAAWAFYASASKERPWLTKMVSATLNTSGQFAIRLVVLIL